MDEEHQEIFNDGRYLEILIGGLNKMIEELVALDVPYITTTIINSRAESLINIADAYINEMSRGANKYPSFIDYDNDKIIDGILNRYEEIKAQLEERLSILK